jgi:transposase
MAKDGDSTPKDCTLPQDVAGCHAVIQQLLEAVHQSQGRIGKLEHQLAQLLRHRYGQHAEKIDTAQLLLFAKDVLASDAEKTVDSPTPQEKPAKSKKRRGRKRLPKDLPRKRMVHELSPEELLCPCCQNPREKISEEVSEQLEYVPASLFVIEHVRWTYACKGCEGHVATASKPMQPIEKGLAGPGLLAHVITSKYADHLPLHRMERILRRHGVDIARSTMCDWMAQCAALLNPLYELMKRRVLESHVVHTDDTPVPVQDKSRTRTRQGRIWTYVGDYAHPYTVFDYTPTHCREGPAEFLGGYHGYLQADAYSGYDHLFKAKGDGAPVPTEVGCWAHARRKFFESQETDPARATVAMAMIRLLYDVEREAKDRAAAQLEQRLDELPASDQPLDPAQRDALYWQPFVDARYALRQQKSVSQLDEIKHWLGEEQLCVLPKSPIGQAIGYALSNWPALRRYSEDGRLNIDNNPAENALRSIVLGRRNWLFAGSDRGGRTAATLCSFIASCRRQEIDPFSYLRDVLSRIAACPINEVAQFLPDRWRSAHIPAEA